MNRLSQKFKSNTGATLLIAIVFMLFCVFVGGSVLAAATVNGARLKRSVEAEQSYLSQRSAALLVAEQLYSTDTLKIDYYPAAEASGFGLVRLEEPEGVIPALRTQVYRCAAELYRNTCEDGFCNPLYSKESVVWDDDAKKAQVDFSLRLDDPAETMYARMYCDTNYTITVSFFNDESYSVKSDTLYLKMTPGPSERPEPVAEGEADPSREAEAEAEAEPDEAPPADWIRLTWEMPKVIKGGAPQ